MRSFLTVAGTVGTILISAMSSPAAHAACGSQGVYVFDAYWCPHCRRVKELLARYNVQYTSIDITNNSRARAFMAQRFNTVAIPVTAADDSFVIGYDERRLKLLLCLP